MKKNQDLELKVIPLGGCNEIGKNCTLFEYDNDIIIIDCGIGFPSASLRSCGVDLIIPDFKYLLKNKGKIRAVILTHGHEDHIGALCYFLQHVSTKIYATHFTLSLFKNRLREFPILSGVEFNTINFSSKVSITKNFQFEFIRTTHSIVDSAAILLETPVGNILHTGDFKIDYTPIDNNKFDFYRFVEIGKKGLLLLLSDSTNSLVSGYSNSEKSIIKSLRQVFYNSPNTIFAATFASHIHRIQILFNLAKEFNRYVALVGKSIESNVDLAIQMGYLNKKDVKIISARKIKDFSRNKVLVITTGTQGESMSVLSLLSKKNHKILKIRKGDSIIISARVIPGNEKEVNRIVNQFFQYGAKVIYEPFYDIHVSGHAYQEELKMMLSFTNPKFFLPLHGEYKNLFAHVQLAEAVGIPYENSKIMKNGDIISLTEENMKKIGSIELEDIYISTGELRGLLEEQVIKDRKKISSVGIFFLVIFWENIVDKKN